VSYTLVRLFFTTTENALGKHKTGRTTLLCIGGSYIIGHNCVQGSVQSGVIRRSDLGTWPATLAVKSSKGHLVGLKWYMVSPRTGHTPERGVASVTGSFKQWSEDLLFQVPAFRLSRRWPSSPCEERS